MDSRERVFLALNFEEPDRVPVDFWYSDGFRKKFESASGRSMEQLLDTHDVDFRYIEGPRYIGPKSAAHPDGTDRDIWGVTRKTMVVNTNGGAETYKEVLHSPLADMKTPEEINAYGGWPSPDWFDYSVLAAQCEEVIRKGKVAVFMGDRLNRVSQLKPAMYLRGVEQILTDMCLAPEIAQTIFANIRAFYDAYMERIFESAAGKLDILLTGDDFGSQNGPLISPAMWTAFLKEGFAHYTGMARSHRVRVMHHTCGSVRPLIPLMIACGLDILQSIQPEARDMDAAGLKKEFGGRLAFQGGISVQKTLPFGTRQEIRDEVRDRVAALGKNGGYIFCTSHNIQADTPVKNAMTLLEAYRDFGRY